MQEGELLQMLALDADGGRLAAADVFVAPVRDKRAGAVLGGLDRLLLVFPLDGHTLRPPIKFYADFAFVLPQPQRLVDDHRQHKEAK